MVAVVVVCLVKLCLAAVQFDKGGFVDKIYNFHGTEDIKKNSNRMFRAFQTLLKKGSRLLETISDTGLFHEYRMVWQKSRIFFLSTLRTCLAHLPARDPK